MRYLFDTDHLSIWQRKQGADFEKLVLRVDSVPLENIFFCDVSFHEQSLGCHHLILQSRLPEKILRGYQILRSVIASFRDATILPYDQRCADVFNAMRRQRVRVSTIDLRIASIALVNAATLLTRNLHDFEQVPGLRIEDWTV